MADESLTEAWAVGRNSYVIDTLAFRGILDVDTQTLRFQYALADSQVWHDWLIVDALGVVTILGLVTTFPQYTVATLPPSPVPGQMAFVTDLADDTVYHGTLIGGGTSVGNVMYTTARGWVLS